MDSILRDGVDLQALSGKAFAGDAYFFEEATTPAKIKEYLDSSKVICACYLHTYISLGDIISQLFFS